MTELPVTTRIVYRADVDQVVRTFRDALGVEPRIWKCTCGALECDTRVVHCRAPDGIVYFIANITTIADPKDRWVLRMQSRADIPAFLAEEAIPQSERTFYGVWFKAGLADAMFAAASA